MADPKDNEQSDCREQSDYWQGKHYRIQRAIAIGGFIGLLVFFLEWCEMRKSTDAATQAIKLSREMSHLDQRAWVSLFQIIGNPEKGKQFYVTVVFKNTGKTFAKSVEMRTTLQAPDDGSIPDFVAATESAFKDLSVEGSNGLVAPEATYTATLQAHTVADHELSGGDIDDLKTGRRKVFIWGKIVYDDIFGCHHWTTFCSYLAFDPSVAIEGGGWRYLSYKIYNKADDDYCASPTPFPTATVTR